MTDWRQQRGDTSRQAESEYLPAGACSHWLNNIVFAAEV
jgi:hypothetical protein